MKTWHKVAIGAGVATVIGGVVYLATRQIAYTPLAETLDTGNMLANGGLVGARVQRGRLQPLIDDDGTPAVTVQSQSGQNQQQSPQGDSPWGDFLAQNQPTLQRSVDTQDAVARIASGNRSTPIGSRPWYNIQ